MPLIGHNNLRKLFERLLAEERISHSYIFFGEDQVGKFTFAKLLASRLETGKFELAKRILQEALTVMSSDGSIGIDEVREIKHFLSQKPVYSDRRVAIVKDAEFMSSSAQHATLKIAEEPPGKSLFILVTQNTDALLPTLQSRFQKIHFPRSNLHEIANFLKKEEGVSEDKAAQIAKLSLGRPGRAKDLISDDKLTELHKTALALINNKKNKKEVVEELMENNDDIYPLLGELIAALRTDTLGNYESLKSITERLSRMAEYSTNKRLQLETALWNI